MCCCMTALFIYIFFVLFSEPNVIDGDILGNIKPGRSRRAATSEAKKLWPRGVIPYVIADHFKSAFTLNSIYSLL